MSRTIPQVTAELAKIRDEYLEMLRDGFGREQMSPEEQAGRLAELEEGVREVFLLAARVRMASALGITNWLVAEMTGAFPEFLGGDAE